MEEFGKKFLSREEPDLAGRPVRTGWFCTFQALIYGSGPRGNPRWSLCGYLEAGQALDKVTLLNLVKWNDGYGAMITKGGRTLCVCVCIPSSAFVPFFFLFTHFILSFCVILFFYLFP